MRFKTTCKDVHRLTSEGLDRELSIAERTRVRMHLLVCDACSIFTEQMRLLRRAMREILPSAGADKENGPE